jgi:Tol biopolymer transport system component
MTNVKMSFYTLGLGFILLLLSGCGLLPDQKTPEPISPTPTQIPTQTSTPTLTPTATPTPTPTPLGGGVGRILYTAYDFDSEIEQIYMVNSDGSEHRSVLEAEQINGNLCFRFSPNGENIAFVHEFKTDEGGNGARLLMTDRNFSNPPVVIDDDFENIDSLDWSSDSKHMAYFGYKIDRYTLTVATLNDGVPIIETVIDPPYLNVSQSVSWSPDGNQFLFSLIWDGNWEIIMVDTEEKTFGPFISHPGMDYRVNWSPDGRYISFASNRDQKYKHDQIFVMNSDGSNINNIVNDPATDGRFHVWSPDSSRIAYLTYRDNEPAFVPNWSLYTVKPDGSGLARVSGEIFNPSNIRWSPDGQFILFQERKLENSVFVYTHYLTPSDGSTPPRMLPEWMTPGFDWSPDGNQIVFYDEGNIYITPVDATEKPEPIIEVDPNLYYSCFSWQP